MGQGEGRGGPKKRTMGRPKNSGSDRRTDRFFSALLKEYEPDYANFQAMSLSVKKTYTRAYFDAKTDAGREKRIPWMAYRLNENLKPM